MLGYNGRLGIGRRKTVVKRIWFNPGQSARLAEVAPRAMNMADARSHLLRWLVGPFPCLLIGASAFAYGHCCCEEACGFTCG